MLKASTLPAVFGRRVEREDKSSQVKSKSKDGKDGGNGEHKPREPDGGKDFDSFKCSDSGSYGQVTEQDPSQC